LIIRPGQAYQTVASWLLDHEVNPLFGLMGDANMLYVADYRERGGRFVPAAHEAGAVAMADAHSRLTGEVAIATVTHGPGLTNTMTALVEAVRSHSPVLLLTGDTPEDPSHFQRIDIAAFAAAAGADHRRIEAAESLRTDLADAHRQLRDSRVPMVLDLPAGLLHADIRPDPDPLPDRDTASGPESRGLADRTRVLRDVDSGLGMLMAANRPLVLAGRGAVEAGAGERLVELADLVGAPLATTVLAKDLFAGHPADLGIFGNLAHPVAADAIAAADTVLAVGASLNRFTTHHRELTRGKRLIHVDLDPARYGDYTGAAQVVVGDALEVVETMVQTLRRAGLDRDPSGRSEWLRRITQALLKYRPGDDFTDQSGAYSLDPRTAAIALDTLLPTQRSLVSDSGRFVNAAWRYLHVPEARRFTAMGGFGAIGLGLAGAVGAAIARSDHPTVAVIGDGGFMMNPAELVTAVREELDLIVLVFNDGAYGVEHHKLIQLGVDPAHSLTPWPPIAQVAEGLGARAHTVWTLDELDELAEVIADRTGPIVIDLRLDPTLDITW
jgi:thiamine pyrophosphate-dependent acetolactate synthase large subunit-like protein